MKKIYDAVLSALKEMDMKFHYDEEKEVFDYQISTEYTTYSQRLVPLEDEELLVAITTFPITVPEEKRFMFCSLLNKINHSLLLGFFTMDAEDGEISFRVSCPVDDGAINKTIVFVAISNSIRTIEKHLPDIFGALSTLPTPHYGDEIANSVAYA